MVLTNIAAIADQAGRVDEALELIEESKTNFDALSKKKFDKYEDYQKDFAKCMSLRDKIQSKRNAKSQ
jgi:hypothetical protein